MDINEVKKELRYQIKGSLSEDLTDDVAPGLVLLEAVNYKKMKRVTLLTLLKLAAATILNKKRAGYKIREALRKHSNNSNVSSCL